MEMKYRKVLVFGSGKSGIGACQLLERHGAAVLLYDGNDKLDMAELKEKLGEKSTVEIVLGDFPEKRIESLDLVVMSPGVPTDLPVINRMREAGIPVWGEIELAYALGQGDVLAITGTNGKTTTTTLLGEIMKACRESVFVVGNIGNPYTCVADQMCPDTVTVAEISSFQLETIEQFCPRVSAILNITPDHLNRHHTMENYIRVKEDIARNQGSGDTCVLNYEDEVLREFGKSIQGRVNIFWFSSQRKLAKGIYLENGNIIYKDREEVTVCGVDELQLLGVHNYENVMAAAAMAISYGVPIETIRTVVKAFKGVEHRIEYVCEKNGVVYYNDSKGT
ncbi:MAG TPA: UDP-N-acetylmuramoyl-L-alanine--D-glutamate ligase, partial [Lachnospiraceae bacterium]|nr:UDP-N-acetylmuramoyl-L-alanine--D-glutamate ligase [Lachnospiraceae bacterium]